MKIDISNKLVAVVIAFPIVWHVTQTIAWTCGY